MKKAIFTLLCAVLASALWAQSPVIEFKNAEHNFGKIKEADGKVTTVFTFKNTGMTPLIINHVTASCGCTVPSWNEAPIEPGATGTITATYDPNRRPGKFAKSILVYSNATQPQLRLIIKGDVLPKPVNLENTYSIRFGQVGFKAATVNFNNVRHNQDGYRIVEAVNFGTKKATLSFENTHPFLHLSAQTVTLKPKEPTRIHIRFIPEKCNEWGPVVKELGVLVNDEKIDKKLFVQATIIEDFSEMTHAERMKAPIVKVSEKTIKLGTLEQNKATKTNIKLTNAGENNLEIRRIMNSASEIDIETNKTSIAGGKSAQLEITVTPTREHKGAFRRTFSIQTNDPENTYQLINVTWSIE